MSEFATPTGEPSGFNQVGSPDAFTSRSGMLSGLYAAADAWDAAASTLTNVASALSTDSKTLQANWQSTAATAVLADLGKTITSADHGSETFRQYAHNLRAIAAYLQKIRNIKSELRNIWRLILIDIFVGLAAIALGFVASEVLGVVFPVLGDLLSSVFGAAEDAGLSGLAEGDSIPLATDEVISASQIPTKDVGPIDAVEPDVTTDPPPGLGEPKPVEPGNPPEPQVVPQTSSEDGNLLSQIKSLLGNTFTKGALKTAGLETTDNIVSGFAGSEFQNGVTTKAAEDLGIQGAGNGESTLDTFLSALEGGPMGAIGSLDSRLLHGLVDKTSFLKKLDKLGSFKLNDLQAPKIPEWTPPERIVIAPVFIKYSEDTRELIRGKKLIKGFEGTSPDSKPIKSSSLPEAPRSREDSPETDVTTNLGSGSSLESQRRTELSRYPSATGTRDSVPARPPTSHPRTDPTSRTSGPTHTEPARRSPEDRLETSGNRPVRSHEGLVRTGDSSPVGRSEPIHTGRGSRTSTGPVTRPGRTEPQSTTTGHPRDAAGDSGDHRGNQGGSSEGGGDRRGRGNQGGSSEGGGDRRGRGNQGGSSGGGGDRRGRGNQGGSSGGGGDRRGRGNQGGSSEGGGDRRGRGNQGGSSEGGGDRRGRGNQGGSSEGGGDRRGGGNQGGSSGGGGDRRGGGNQGRSSGGGGDRRGGGRQSAQGSGSARPQRQRSRKIAGRIIRHDEDRASLLAPTTSGRQDAPAEIYDSEGEDVVHDFQATVHSDLNEGTSDVVPLASRDIRDTINHADSYADIESEGETRRIYVRRVDELRPAGPPVEREVWKLVPVEATARPFVVKTAFASIRLQGKYHSLYEEFKAGAGSRAGRGTSGETSGATRLGPERRSSSLQPRPGPSQSRHPEPPPVTARQPERVSRARRRLFQDPSVEFRYEPIVRTGRDDPFGKAPADSGSMAGSSHQLRPSASKVRSLGDLRLGARTEEGSSSRAGPPQSGKEEATAATAESTLRRLRLSDLPRRQQVPTPEASSPRTTEPSSPRTPEPTTKRTPQSRREIEREQIREQFWREHENRDVVASPVGSDFSRSPYVPPGQRNPRVLRTPTRSTSTRVPHSASKDTVPSREGSSLRELAERAGPKGVGRPNEAQRRLSKVKQGLKHYTLFHATDRTGEEVVGDTNALLHILERHRTDEFRVKPTEIKRLIEHADFHGDFREPPKGEPAGKEPPKWTRIYFTHERTVGQRLEKRNRYHVVVVNRSMTPRRVEQAYGADEPPRDVRLQQRAPKRHPERGPSTSSKPTTSARPAPGQRRTSETSGPSGPRREDAGRPSERKDTGSWRRRGQGPAGGPPRTSPDPPAREQPRSRASGRGPGPQAHTHYPEPPSRPAREEEPQPRRSPLRDRVLTAGPARVDAVNWYRPVEGGGYVFERTSAPGEVQRAEHLGTAWVPGQGGGAYLQRWRFVDEWGIEHVGETWLPGGQAYLNRWHYVDPSGNELIGETLLPPDGGQGSHDVVNWFRRGPDGSALFVGSSVVGQSTQGATFLGTTVAQPGGPPGPPLPPLW